MIAFDFTKMHGTGNDFIVVDNRGEKNIRWKPELVKLICDRRLGIGADGLLLLEESQPADFRMRYFNSDGFESEMCANGSRCICAFAFRLKLCEALFSFEANDGIHRAKILKPDHIRVQVFLHRTREDRTFPADFSLPEGVSFVGFMNTGVPHLILETDSLEKVDVQGLGGRLRFHEYYRPQGTNVNFVFRRKESGIAVRTFERGVDAETLSCGSGVTAAAIAMRRKYNIRDRKISVFTHGGNLSVDFSEEEDSIFLEGPVKFVFEGTYRKEVEP